VPSISPKGADKKSKNPSKWIYVESDAYQSVAWDRSIEDKAGYLYCNGILVGDFYRPPTDLIVPEDRNSLWELRPPTISIIDNDGNLPLDLARKALVKKDEELSRLVVESIAEEYIASIFSLPGETPSELLAAFERLKCLYRIHSWKPLAFDAFGFFLLDDPLINDRAPDKFMIQTGTAKEADTRLSDDFLREGIVAIRNTAGGGSKTSLLGAVTGTGYWANHYPGFTSRYTYEYHRSPFSQSCVYLDKASFDLVFELKQVPKYVQDMRKTACTFEIAGREYVVASQTKNPNPSLQDVAEFLSRTTAPKEDGLPAVLWTGFSKKPRTETVLSKKWKESFTNISLPYRRTEREGVLRTSAPIKKYLCDLPE
jgi:hypothetical protein